MPRQQLSLSIASEITVLTLRVCVSGLLASVPSTNGNGNGGMMAYSPGEQQPGTNGGNSSSQCNSVLWNYGWL